MKTAPRIIVLIFHISLLVSCLSAVAWAKPPTVLLETAIELIASPQQGSAVFGWNAVEAILSESKGDVSSAAISQIQKLAVKHNSVESLSALLALYRYNPKIRVDTIANPNIELTFHLALLGESFSDLPNEKLALAKLNVSDVSDYDREMANKALLQIAVVLSSDQLIEEDINNIAGVLDPGRNETRHHFIAVLLAIKNLSLAQAALGLPLLDTRSNLREAVLACSQSTESKQAIDILISKICLQFISKIPSSLKLKTDTKMSDPKNDAPDLGSENIKFVPTSTASATGINYVITASLDIGGQLISAGSAALYNTNRADNDFYASLTRQSGPSPDWKCVAGSHSWIVGLCHNPYTNTETVSSGSLDGKYQITSMGVVQRAWVGGTSWASSRSADAITFDLYTRYFTGSNTNWLAVRWRGSAPSDLVTITCAKGCQEPESTLTEPFTKWTIFAVVPGQTEVVFKTQSRVTLTVVDSDRQFPIGVKDTRETLEVIEFDEATANTVQSLDLRDLGGGFSRLPLVRYVASTQRELRTNGWFVPNSKRVEFDAALSLSRQKLYSAAVDQKYEIEMPLEHYQLSSWRERQAFALKSQKIIALRSFEKYRPRLESSLETMSGLFEIVVSIQTQLSDAVGKLHKINSEQAHLLLKKAAKYMKTDAMKSNSSMEHLQVALYGADAAVNRLVNEMTRRKALACTAYRQLSAAAGLGNDTEVRGQLKDYCSPDRKEVSQ